MAHYEIWILWIIAITANPSNATSTRVSSLPVNSMTNPATLSTVKSSTTLATTTTVNSAATPVVTLSVRSKTPPTTTPTVNNNTNSIALPPTAKNIKIPTTLSTVNRPTTLAKTATVDSTATTPIKLSVSSNASPTTTPTVNNNTSSIASSTTVKSNTTPAALSTVNSSTTLAKPTTVNSTATPAVSLPVSSNTPPSTTPTVNNNTSSLESSPIVKSNTTPATLSTVNSSTTLAKTTTLPVSSNAPTMTTPTVNNNTGSIASSPAVKSNTTPATLSTVNSSTTLAKTQTVNSTATPAVTLPVSSNAPPTTTPTMNNNTGSIASSPAVKSNTTPATLSTVNNSTTLAKTRTANSTATTPITQPVSSNAPTTTTPTVNNNTSSIASSPTVKSNTTPATLSTVNSSTTLAKPTTVNSTATPAVSLPVSSNTPPSTTTTVNNNTSSLESSPIVKSNTTPATLSTVNSSTTLAKTQTVNSTATTPITPTESSNAPPTTTPSVNNNTSSIALSLIAKNETTPTTLSTVNCSTTLAKTTTLPVSSNAPTMTTPTVNNNTGSIASSPAVKSNTTPATLSTVNSSTTPTTLTTVNSTTTPATTPILNSNIPSTTTLTVNSNTNPIKPLSTVTSITTSALSSSTTDNFYSLSLISTSEAATAGHTTFATPHGITNAAVTTTMHPAEEVNFFVFIQSSPFTVEQEKGYIRCSFERNSTINNPNTVWSKNGLILSNSSAAVIHSSCNGGLNCTSDLILFKVNILSKGEYRCDVQIKAPGVNYKGQAATNVIVQQKPVTVIEPIRSSVMEGTNVSVHCNVTNTEQACLGENTVIKMCFANKTDVQDCHSKSKCDLTCNFSMVSNMTIKCGLGNCSNNSITSTITVVSKGDKLCKSDDQWPSTQQGLEASIPCPKGYSGVVTKKCLMNGIWDKRNNSKNCKQAELEQIENILNSTRNLTADVVETSLSSISSIVNNSISSSNENKLADNDIKQSVDLIFTISKKPVHFTDQEAANKTTQVFMGIVSDILNTGKNKVSSTDTNKKEKEKEVTSKILASVNSFAISVSKALKVNQTVTVKKPNMLLSIEKIEKNTDIKFPKETEDNKQQLQAHFMLPQGALKNITGNDVAFTAVKYDNIGSEFISENHKEVDSSVLSLTVDGLNSKSLNPNITLSFQRKNGTSNSTDCVFLWKDNNDTHSVWNTSGCSLKNVIDSQVNCSCNHLTNFAILMSYTDVPNSKEDIKRLKLISVFGCSLSIIGAFVTIVLYIYFWRYIKSRRSTLVINLCSALCIAYLLFLTAVEHSENKTGCIIIAVLLHYFFLAMFTTMLCLGIDLAVAVFDVFSSRSRSFIFLLVSWGLPAVIVGITLGGSQLEGYGDETYCWLRHTTLFGFIVPVLCIVLVNSIIVIVVMRKIYTSSFMMKKSLKEKTLSGLRGICVLLPILGLTWVFGIFSVNQDLIIFQYLFAIFNSLQGLFIFLFYVALNPQMREAVARKIKIYDSRSSISKTSKTTKFVSTSYSEEEQEFSEREDGVVASNMYIIPRCSVQNKQFNKRQ